MVLLFEPAVTNLNGPQLGQLIARLRKRRHKKNVVKLASGWQQQQQLACLFLVTRAAANEERISARLRGTTSYGPSRVEQQAEQKRLQACDWWMSSSSGGSLRLNFSEVCLTVRKMDRS